MYCGSNDAKCEKALFLLQSTGRSGSTYLRSLICAHPHLTMKGEFLYPDPTVDDWSFYKFLRDYVGKSPMAISPQHRALVMQQYVAKLSINEKTKLGRDLKLEQLDLDPALITPVYEIAHGGVIHLKRTNLLKQVVSYELMMKRLATGNTEVHSSTHPPIERVRINPDFVVSQMRYLFDLNMKCERIARKMMKPLLKVVYEDLLFEKDRTFASITDFLERFIF